MAGIGSLRGEEFPGVGQRQKEVLAILTLLRFLLDAHEVDGLALHAEDWVEQSQGEFLPENLPGGLPDFLVVETLDLAEEVGIHRLAVNENGEFAGVDCLLPRLREKCLSAGLAGTFQQG